MEFLPQVKTFQIYYWTCLPSQENFFLSVELIVKLSFLIFISLKMDSHGFRVPFELQPFDKFI